MEVLKTIIHILNQVSSKSVSKTSYKLWTGRKPSLNYLHVWGYLAQAKVFNPNVGKLDSKKVSCYFIGYREKSKGYRFYCPDRHTKSVETRHTVFLEKELIRGSMVVREINIKEKRVYVPTLMVQEPFFTLPVVAAPTVQDTVVTAPVVSSPVATINKHEEPVLQDPIEPGVAHVEEQQQPHMEQALEAPRRSQKVRKSAIPDDYEVYDTEEFLMEGDPTSFEEVMRSAHSSKWLEAMQDKMRSMSTNKLWDLKKFLKEPRQ
jgi:hypothetical protein